MSKYKYERQFIFSDKKLSAVKLFLNDLKNVDISKIKDDKLNTVLHQCAYQCSLEIMQLYVEFMKIYWKNPLIGGALNSVSKTFKTQAEINQALYIWVNEQNK